MTELLPGKRISCLYPLHGRGELIERSGVIEHHILRPNHGHYVTVKCDNGLYRNFIVRKAVNLVVN